MRLSAPVLIIGLVTGLTYSILGIGLVLVYKSAKFINFAHGQMGALSALAVAIGTILITTAAPAKADHVSLVFAPPFPLPPGRLSWRPVPVSSRRASALPRATFREPALARGEPVPCG